MRELRDVRAVKLTDIDNVRHPSLKKTKKLTWDRKHISNSIKTPNLHLTSHNKIGLCKRENSAVYSSEGVFAILDKNNIMSLLYRVAKPLPKHMSERDEELQIQ